MLKRKSVFGLALALLLGLAFAAHLAAQSGPCRWNCYTYGQDGCFKIGKCQTQIGNTGLRCSQACVSYDGEDWCVCRWQGCGNCGAPGCYDGGGSDPLAFYSDACGQGSSPTCSCS